MNTYGTEIELQVKVKFSSQKFNILDFRILTVILAVYLLDLLDIVLTGEQCWRNARFIFQGHCVTFKFR